MTSNGSGKGQSSDPSQRTAIRWSPERDFGPVCPGGGEGLLLTQLLSPPPWTLASDRSPHPPGLRLIPSIFSYNCLNRIRGTEILPQVCETSLHFAVNLPQ
ncbi:hypothetical protein J437_LFUL007850 [Ladona fulva]|uniref:Uncharacterized protein n=1 Tax=Ladona fulva TaxID=123851 RepID=A0A8K0K511_LADFU|nr:hypothetical protein J437_LFUL007850 [Ladona fulva]